MKMTKILAMAAVAGATALTAAEKPTVEIVSSKMRANDPTVMEVEYCVHAATNRVDVRALGFKDGTRSFANVVRVETLLDGSVFGDDVPANTTNSFAWKVSSDWKVDLANVAIEVLAKNAGDGIVPLEFATIPENGNNVEMTVSKNTLTKDHVFDALLWLYADKDETMTLTNGTLSDDYGTLASRASLSNANAARHIYEKMEYRYLNDCHLWLSYARAARREKMMATYGYAVKCDIPKVEMGNGLYMVIDLEGTISAPITYLDAAPSGGWSDDYKTKKIVLRRIDSASGVYYAGVFQITQAQWAYVMGEGDKTSKSPKNGVSYIDIRGSVKGSQYPDSTAVDISSFMGQLRLMTGLDSFDLPSDDEWVFSARAGATTKYLCGDTTDGLDEYAWYSGNSGNATHEVGLKKANDWGLYDVHGNVWEWCLDWYPGYEGSYRVLRGGAFLTDASYCAFACRYFNYPSDYWDYFGFRLFCRSGSN